MPWKLESMGEEEYLPKWEKVGGGVVIDLEVGRERIIRQLITEKN